MLAFDTATEKWSDEREKDGEGGSGERVGSLTFLWAMCVSSVNAFGFF